MWEIDSEKNTVVRRKINLSEYIGNKLIRFMTQRSETLEKNGPSLRKKA